MLHELGHNLGFEDVFTSGCDGSTVMYWTLSQSSLTQLTDCDQAAISSCYALPPPPPDTHPDQRGDTGDCYQYGNCNTPIVIDLGKGGYALSGRYDSVWFDIDADGIPDRIGWTTGGTPTGFLALDRNHNGRIDDGSELFGNHTPLANGAAAANGFDALTQFDTNRDGIINANDRIWPSLLLWTDLNHDGISQPSEIVPLGQSPVRAISLDYHWTGRRDEAGNTFRYASHAWIRDASNHDVLRPIYDIIFVHLRKNMQRWRRQTLRARWWRRRESNLSVLF